MDQHELVALANAKMPFGKYKDRLLMDIPENYLLWLSKKGFPAGKLGRQLQLLLEIKTNGLTYLLKPLVHR